MSALCLIIWQGTNVDVGPFMHSIHFAFSAGAFLAPMVATPFLSPTSKQKETVTNISEGHEQDQLPSQNFETHIPLLYASISATLCLLSLGYLFLHVYNIKSVDTSR